MHFSTLLAATFASLATASPLLKRCVNASEPFFLVTSSQASHSANSSALANASATTIFDPLYQTNYLLRLLAPGYNSLPNFTLTSGQLHTVASGPHGLGEYEYNSTEVYANSELQFAPSAQTKGDLSLIGGYLLAVNGSFIGWTICTPSGALGEQVIEYAGSDASCLPTYIHATSLPPY